MTKFSQKSPLHLSGLALGLAALGNLMVKYGMDVRYFFGGLSVVCFLTVTVFILMYFQNYLKEMSKPALASSFGTYTMAGMILSTYIKPLYAQVSLTLWSIFLFLHLVLIIYFTVKFTVRRDILMVFPSWFIVYVGIAVASVTAPLYEAYAVGQLAFWFGLVTYLILLPFVVYRLLKVKQIPDFLLPSIAINSAPASLLLAGYINSFSNYQPIIFYGLVMVSQLIFVITLMIIFKLLKKPFFPTFSALTFPFVITALSISLANDVMIQASSGLTLVVLSETWFAVMMVSYVSISFLRFYLD